MSVSARRKDIEGMRALAVGLVVANHAGVSWLSGGYIGVDVFFVISGFLITKLLLDEGDSQGRISLSQFWARRARRILPMSIVVTLATVVVGLFALEPGKVRELTAVALGALGFSTNFVLFATSSDYLSGVTAPSPLRHMWSLAVEEQFYLLWPLVVFGFVKYFRSRWKMWLGIFGLVAGIASLLTSALISKNHPTAAYYMPYTRFWEIAAGALLAVVGIHVQRINPWLRAMFGWLGLIGIGIAAVGFSDTTVFDTTVFPGYAALLPVLSTMAVLIAADTHRGPHFLLSCEPLQALGARSYSLYLWHWPLLVLAEARFGNLNVGVKCVIAFAAIALSFVSYQYVEQPVRHQSWLSAKSRRTLVGAGSVLAVTLSSVFVLFAIAPKIDAGALALAEAS
ncbi:MAG: acyltransferase, partial [Actinobacteria bacterium]|nr:acyltransferase [Actinomycetota bacterium]